MLLKLVTTEPRVPISRRRIFLTIEDDNNGKNPLLFIS